MSLGSSQMACGLPVALPAGVAGEEVFDGVDEQGASGIFGLHHVDTGIDHDDSERGEAITVERRLADHEAPDRGRGLLHGSPSCLMRP